MTKGNKVLVTNPDKAEEADVVVCVELTDPLMLLDNVAAVCSMCGCGIQHRPDAPKAPPKVCMPCILPKVAEAAQEDNLNVMITKKTADEVALYFSEQKTKH